MQLYSCSTFSYPELEYLHKGIKMHHQLSTLGNYKNRKERQNLIRSAEKLFDISIHKLDYGVHVSRIRLNLGWSVFEFCKQFWLLCRDTRKRFKNQTPALFCGSLVPMTVSTSCYLRDRDSFLENLCSFSEHRTEIGFYPILQEIVLSELILDLPANPTYVVCSAYRANFFYNALGDYRKAIELCQEVDQILKCSSVYQLGYSFFADFVPFPLRNEWHGLYDKTSKSY